MTVGVWSMGRALVWQRSMVQALGSAAQSQEVPKILHETSPLGSQHTSSSLDWEHWSHMPSEDRDGQL